MSTLNSCSREGATRLNTEYCVIAYSYVRDAMLAWVIAIATCPSVYPSVCHTPALCQNEESKRHDAKFHPDILRGSPEREPQTRV